MPPSPHQPRPPLAVPQADLARLFALFNAGQYVEMESRASALAASHPMDGQAWKAWSVALMAQGKDAGEVLERATALLPADADLAANLGGVLAGQGELDRAAASYQRALQLKPGFAQAHSSLGDVLARQGRWLDAEAHCRQAIGLSARLAAAHLNLGNALIGQGRVDDAVASFQEALAIAPGLAAAHFALGVALKDQGLLAQAAASLRQAVQLRPAHALSHDQLGMVLMADGQLEAALASLQAAVRLHPGFAAAQFHLGRVLAELGRWSEAAASYRSALSLETSHAEVHARLAVALLQLGEHAQALAAFRQAAAWAPEQAVAHINLGNVLLAQGCLAEAAACHERAVSLAPDLALAHSNLGHALKVIGQADAAVRHLQQALALEPQRLPLHSEVLFARQYQDPGAEQQGVALADARRFGAMAADQASPFASWPNLKQRDKRLRVGLLSGDLRAHPVAYFIESVLAALAGRSLEVHAYCNHDKLDEVSRRLQAHCQGWRGVAGLDDAALARRIHDDGIDILIDLSGHTNHNRLPVLAWRPAPVQACWLGYCATTGLQAVDAFIADPWIAPCGAETLFTERIWRLPDTFLCFTPPTVEAPVTPLPALARGSVRFGCFNHLAKINDAVVAAWAQALHAVPGGELALQAHALQDPAVCHQVLDRFARHGIDPRRLLLQAAQSRAEYLAAYGQIDIALDPFPYPGGTTSLEALWMGVPVLTMAGSTALARQGVSIMGNLGLRGWVADDARSYVRLAVQHASDLAALAALRGGLRDRLLQSPLCDAPRFAGHLEACLRAMWQRWCDPDANPPAA